MTDGRLDYGNSVQHRTSLANINKLQRVQNSAARIVTKSSRSDHIIPGLAELHWLQTAHREFTAAIISCVKFGDDRLDSA
jgi:hypothetical protein